MGHYRHQRPQTLKPVLHDGMDKRSSWILALEGSGIIAIGEGGATTRS